jgi:hypothetical protein
VQTMIRCLLLIALFQPAFAQQLPADWPHWAYGYLGQPTADEMAVVPPCPENAVPRSCGPTGTPLEDDGIKLSLPGTSASFTRVEANYSWGPADWYPGDHPPMPEIVATGMRMVMSQACPSATSWLNSRLLRPGIVTVPIHARPIPTRWHALLERLRMPRNARPQSTLAP